MAANRRIHASAPARVNLIGEHVDYNDGFVLPTVLPRLLEVELTPRDDDLVEATSGQCPGESIGYQLGRETPRRDWLDYVQGATRLLAGEGHRLRGFALHVHSTIPLGSGLSSGAALSVALLRALRQGFDLDVDDLAIARFGQRIENEFVGAMVGIMDPMACSLGRPGKALFLDCQSRTYELIPIPPGAEFVVIHSGLAHCHAAGDYNTRRAECERACALLGVGSLRALGPGDADRVAALPDPYRRRARHVATENARVLAAVDALRAGDWPAIGELFNASHASQRNDYEVSIPEIDLLVELACRQEGVWGARLTGGGFGGSIVAVANAGQGAAAGKAITAEFRRRAGADAALIAPVETV